MEKLQLLEIIDESHKTKTFRFSKPSFTYKAGQFVFIYIGEDKRAYSIASSPLDDFFELTLELVNNGKFTSYFHNEAKIGEYFEISEPKGNFAFTDDLKDVTLIAGGSGIVPMRSIIRYCTKKRLNTKIRLFHSGKSKEDLIFMDELSSLGNSNLDLNFTITQDNVNWQGRKSRFDTDMIIKESTTYFICGSNSFVKNIMDALLDNGVLRQSIKVDLWGY